MTRAKKKLPSVKTLKEGGSDIGSPSDETGESASGKKRSQNDGYRTF